MKRTPNRRDFLVSGLSAVTFGLAGCSGVDEDPERGSVATPSLTSSEYPTKTQTTDQAPTATPEQGWNVEPLVHDKLVGAHYYAWYWGEGGYGIHTHRPWLEHSPYTPELGQYDSRHEDVINQHIKWAVENGINWLIVTAGHHHSELNRNIEVNFMQAELIDEISFSILTGFDHLPVKDSQGRTEMGNELNRKKIRDRFEYFDNTFFHDSNYLHVRDRPVLFDFSTPSLTGDIEGAFEQAREETGVNPYMVGNPGKFWPPPIEEPSKAYNAFQKYATLRSDGNYEDGFVEDVGRKSREWLFRTEYHDFGFMPTVMPGFNDTEIEWYGRTKHPVLELSEEEFRGVCSQALEYMDSDLDAVVITSWNEFPEGSTLEPAEEYGHKRLDIVREELALKEADPLPMSDYALMELDFNKAIKPAHIKDSKDERSLSFMAVEIEFLSKDGAISYDIGISEDEPVFVHGVYGREESEENPPSTWRWFGGPDTLTAIYVDPAASAATEAALYGKPQTDNEIEADVYYNGKHTDHIAFGERTNEISRYDVSLK